MVPVGAERGAGARDREVGAGDDAERAVERHGQHAAQRRQRPPDVGMLHEISEIFVGREAEAGGGAVDHGVHRVGEGAALPRDRDDHQHLDDLLGRGDAEQRTQRLRHPGIAGDRENLGKRRAGHSQQRNAGRAEQKGDPDPGGGPGRSSAAITSHSNSSAGATAAAPMTVGRD